MIVYFKYYLHDDYNLHELKEYVENQLEMEIGEELASNIADQFYEVEFQCTLNTETGRVGVITVK
jgi:uncharacterized membrane protein